MTGPQLRERRHYYRLTQKELAEALGYTQPYIAQLEAMPGPIPEHIETRVNELFPPPPPPDHAHAAGDAEEGEPEQPGRIEPEDYETLGQWLLAEREKRGYSRQEVANLTGLSSQTIYNIEVGKIGTPRTDTLIKLFDVLGEPPERIKRDFVAAREQEQKGGARIEGNRLLVGPVFDFNPHSDEELPEKPGVYLLYDSVLRPTYVGESANIRRRLRQHSDRFWYRSPVVETGSYIEIHDQELRRAIEGILIKILRYGILVNKNLRWAPPGDEE